MFITTNTVLKETATHTVNLLEDDMDKMCKRMYINSLGDTFQVDRMMSVIGYRLVN